MSNFCYKYKFFFKKLYVGIVALCRNCASIKRKMQYPNILLRKLKEDKIKKGRSVFKNFRDPILTNSQAMLDLIDIIQPGSIGYDMVFSGNSNEVSCSPVYA